MDSGIPFSNAKKEKKSVRKHKRPKTPSKPKPKRKSLTRQRRKSKDKKDKSKDKSKNKSKHKRCPCGIHTYTGHELTPRGFGRCEECIPDHVVLVGKDNHLYKNKESTWIKVI
tara:strand:+ start:79 stop:417 length:339 start_codon:yes stop_codon:yes gene_type:complete